MATFGGEIDPIRYGALQQQVANLCSDVASLTKSVEALTDRVEKLSNLLSEAKGGWKVLAAGASAAALLGGGVSWIIFHVRVIP